MASSLNNPSPGPSDPLALVADLACNKDDGTSLHSSYDKIQNATKHLNVLHIENIPIGSSYDTLHKSFSKFGTIKEIRMKLQNSINSWEAWITYTSFETTLEASKNVGQTRIDECKLTGALCDRAPENLDIYKPDKWNEKTVKQNLPEVRSPKPPTWIIATGKNERYNYYKMSQYIQNKVGNIKRRYI